MTSKTVVSPDFVPDYSGGTAPEFNGIPYYANQAPQEAVYKTGNTVSRGVLIEKWGQVLNC